MENQTMLAVVKDSATLGVSLKQVPIPVPKEGEVLVKVLHSSICGTDVGLYDWTIWAQQNLTPPTIIGHEMVGEIVKINSQEKTHLKVGDLVSSETHIFCGNCSQCQMGNFHICENLQLFGIQRDGSFAEYCTIPIKTTWKNDLTINPEVMSVQEPLGNAVHAVSKAQVKDKRVLIVGLGPVGLCAGGVARIFGAKEVVGIDRSEYRQNLAGQTGWFDKVVDQIPLEKFNFFDMVLEMSGNQSGIQTGLDAVKIGGKLIAFGIPKDQITLDWGKYLINKELTIESIFGRIIWTTWEQVSSILKSQKLDLSKIITHRFKLSEFDEAINLMKSGQCGKIILTP